MIRESSIIEDIEDFRDAAQNKYEAINEKLKNNSKDDLIKAIKNDLQQDLVFMESNLNISILNDIDENFIKKAIKDDNKNNFEELMKFEKFLQFFYQLNLQIRSLIIRKLTESYYKAIETLKVFKENVILKPQQLEDFTDKNISGFNSIYDKDDGFDLEFCRCFTLFLYSELEKMINISLMHWYQNIINEPFHLALFHRININSNSNLNEKEFRSLVKEMIKTLYDPDIFNKLD